MTTVEQLNVAGSRVRAAITEIDAAIDAVERYTETEYALRSARSSLQHVLREINDRKPMDLSTMIDKSYEGNWTLYADLCEQLGLDSNYDVNTWVDEQVKAAGANTKFGTYTFDTESGGFCVFAPKRDTIQKIAGLISADVNRRRGY